MGQAWDGVMHSGDHARDRISIRGPRVGWDINSGTTHRMGYLSRDDGHRFRDHTWDETCIPGTTHQLGHPSRGRCIRQDIHPGPTRGMGHPSRHHTSAGTTIREPHMGWDVHPRTMRGKGHQSKDHISSGTSIHGTTRRMGHASPGPSTGWDIPTTTKALRGGRFPVPGTPSHCRVSNPSQSVFFAGDEGI